MDFSDDLPKYRHVSHLLDHLDEARAATVCPFCSKAKVHVEMMENASMGDDGIQVGFFTCTSCGLDWSHRVDARAIE
jgi:hypothetical protein